MWSGLEPEEGVVNETYVNLLQQIVTGLGERGVYTYLDMHQGQYQNRGSSNFNLLGLQVFY